MTERETPLQPAAEPATPAPERPAYTPPTLQPLGEWTARTLFVSLPIGPGGIVQGTRNSNNF